MAANWVKRLFRLDENKANWRSEFLAGLTTFLAMAYIAFVQPAVLSGSMFAMDTGMDFGAVMVATCLSAALASVLMGVLANYPIAQAPGMGHNFFFVFSVIPLAAQSGAAQPWRVALGVVFIAGILFLLLSLTPLRAWIMDAMSPSLKAGITVGIGLFIALIGLKNGGLIRTDPSTGFSLNTDVAALDVIVFFFGLFVMAVCLIRKMKGALLWGILAGTLLALGLYGLRNSLPRSWFDGSMLAAQFIPLKGVVSAPPPLSPTLFQMDLAGALSKSMIPMILIFLLMDIFDTIGTLIGVTKQAGLLENGKLPRARRAFLSDAIGTVAGATLGTSTVTSYIESATGVQAGGRTGLTSVVTGLFFLATLFFLPVVQTVASYPPLTAPVLIVVGAMMVSTIQEIHFDAFNEVLPAFFVILGIPLCFSIADGIALGFIVYAGIHLLSGRARQVPALVYIMAVILGCYFFFLR